MFSVGDSDDPVVVVGAGADVVVVVVVEVDGLLFALLPHAVSAPAVMIGDCTGGCGDLMSLHSDLISMRPVIPRLLMRATISQRI